MFYKNSYWKCILDYACGIFQAEKDPVGYQSRENHYFLNTPMFSEQTQFMQDPVLMATPTFHYLCPNQAALIQFPWSQSRTLLRIPHAAATHTDQEPPDNTGLIEKKGPAEALLQVALRTTATWRSKEQVMPTGMGLNPWEKMGGSKQVSLPFLLYPPLFPHHGLFQRCSMGLLGASEDITWARHSTQFVIYEVVTNSVAHPCVFVLPPYLSHLLFPFISTLNTSLKC